MKHVLPTTVAGAVVAPGAAWVDVAPGAAWVDVDLFWVGDSRVYAISTWAGLQLLTCDHTRTFDPLGIGGGDSPMSNMVNASSDFVVDQHRVRLSEPAMVIAATDGVFGYLPTHVDVERHLLDAAADASSLADWSRRLAARIDGYTGDGASLAVHCVGSSSWTDLRDRLLAGAAGRPEDDGRYLALLP